MCTDYMRLKCYVHNYKTIRSGLEQLLRASYRMSFFIRNDLLDGMLDTLLIIAYNDIIVCGKMSKSVPRIMNIC